jgi:L-amino acid N-acyltransferase YncA
MTSEGVRQFPQSVKLSGYSITLRYMEPRDRAAIIAFARAMPQHDLLFLRRDIRQESEVDAWIADNARGTMTTVIAERDGEVLGYGSMSRNELSWSAHVAELRVSVSPMMRGKGLGRILTQEVFAIALGDGVEKMMAQMTLDQKGAIATFEGMGFRPEALLRDHVKDRDGNKHDLLVLSHEVARFEAQRNAYGVNGAFGA